MDLDTRLAAIRRCLRDQQVPAAVAGAALVARARAAHLLPESHRRGLGCVAVSAAYGADPCDPPDRPPDAESVLLRVGERWLVGWGTFEGFGLAGADIAAVMPPDAWAATRAILEAVTGGDRRPGGPLRKRVVTACCGVVEAVTSYEAASAQGGVAVVYRYWHLATHGWGEQQLSAEDQAWRRLVEQVCDLVEVPVAQRPALRPVVLTFLDWLSRQG